MSKLRRTNFQEIINDLIRSGYTQVELAKLSGTAQSQISLLKTGINKSLNYEPGRILVELHDDLNI